jgi:predicted membrane channel-forming protein YqfA (hemolysin III family)
LVLFFLLLPMGVRAVRRGVKTDPFNLPRKEWQILAVLLVYYAAHFYLFMFMAAEHLRASLTWQMFSAGWILMFMLSTFYYWARFVEKRP